MCRYRSTRAWPRSALEIGGQTLTYAHGPIQPMMMQWPGTGGNTLMRLTMTPANGGQATIIENDGAMVAAAPARCGEGHARAASRTSFRITFTSPAGMREFELNASSVRNPFTMTALRAFRCPAKL